MCRGRYHQQSTDWEHLGQVLLKGQKPSLNSALALSDWGASPPAAAAHSLCLISALFSLYNIYTPYHSHIHIYITDVTNTLHICTCNLSCLS